MKNMQTQVCETFAARYGEGGQLFASPGRINLIGEHTDYNGGFVFPGAVDKGIVAAIRPNHTNQCRVYAIDMQEEALFGLTEEESWAFLGLVRSGFFRLRDQVFLACIREGYLLPDTVSLILDFFAEGPDGEPLYTSPYARIL